MKKPISFVMGILLLFVSSCTAMTPKNSYTAKMGPAVELLGTWESSFTEFDTLLTEQLDPATGITRLQLIDLYNIATEEYHISREDYSSVGLTPLDALVGPSVNLSREGNSILETLSTVTPDETMQADHQVLVDCIKARVAFTDELSTSLKELTPIDMSKAGDLIACDTFNDALQKVTTFVNENQ